MSNPWLIAIVSGVLSLIILGVITGIVRFTREGGLIIKFFNGVTEEKLNKTKEEIVEGLPSIGIKSGKKEFEHFKGSNYDKGVLEKMRLMQKDAPEFREIEVYYNEDKSSYFKKRPEIILGISSVNSEHTVEPANLAIEATVSEVYEDSFRLQVKTFHNSYFYKVKVDWLAYGIKK